MTEHIHTEIENIRFNKTKGGADFLIKTGYGCELKEYYFGGKIYATDFFEILFFSEADGSMWINDRKVEIGTNRVVFLSPYQRHCYHIRTDSTSFKFLIFKEDFLHDFLTDKYFTYRLHFSYQMATPPILQVVSDRMKRYFDVLEEIKQELNLSLTNVEPILRSLLYYLLSQLNRTYAEAYNLPSIKIDNTIAYRFKQLMEQNIRRIQRVADYANLLGVSRITLNKAVKSQFGLTATELLKNRLVLEIKEDLIGGQIPIKSISDCFGFSEPNHLMRFFKAQTGKTIGEYMNEYSLDKIPYPLAELNDASSTN